MGESNGDWGALAEHSDEAAQAWDSFDRLPEPGDNPALDAFLARKRLDYGALTRIGARLSAPDVLAFAFAGGIKYRNIVTDHRSNWFGSSFSQLKIIRGTNREVVIVCEGETDAARLTMLYDCDVALMPAGAKAWRDSYTTQVEGYRVLLVGLDNDEAGEAGYRKIKKHLRHAVRFTPPAGAKDWCALDESTMPVPELPTEAQGAVPVVVTARQLLTLATDETGSWFDQAVLPLAGSMVLHGSYKSYKTWVALSLAQSLATGRAWCTFESTDDAAKVAYFNFEIPWFYFRERVAKFADTAEDRELFLDNFHAYGVPARPRLTTGNAESEDKVIEHLLDAGIMVAIIDPVRRAIGFADMNAENEVRRMLHFSERLNDVGITSILLHHDNKDSDRGGGGDPSGMTGSGAWAGDVDTIVSISRPKGVLRQEPKRNLTFLLRNAPAPADKGFTLGEDASVTYHEHSHVESIDPKQHDPGRNI